MRKEGFEGYFVLIAFAIVAIAVSSITVSADMGPYPTNTINIDLREEKSGSNVNFAILQCLSEAESTQGGFCDNNPKEDYDLEVLFYCRGLSLKIPDLEKGCTWRETVVGACRKGICETRYQTPDEFRVAVHLLAANKTFISNSIGGGKFRGRYNLELNSDNTASITDTTPLYWNTLVQALIITLILELIVALAFFSAKKISKIILIWVAVANLISLPLLWLGIRALANVPLGEIGGSLVLIFGEIVVFAFEALFIFVINRKRITIQDSFYLSLFMNLASAFLGSAILLVIKVMG